VTRRRLASVASLAIATTVAFATVLAVASTAGGPSLAQLNEQLFAQLQSVHALGDQQIGAIRAIFARSGFIGQGNPAISRHPVGPGQCLATLQRQSTDLADARFERICGARHMAPLYDPKTARPEQAGACIDQFEFPNIPCALPVVWVRAREAAQICQAMGKRLCDAHEWEGACAGSLEAPDYRFDLARKAGPETAVSRMRAAHNRAREPEKSWSYGSSYQRGICAAGSAKTPGCEGGGWNRCGSNTYPAGSFPACRSTLGVYDLHGNAAEHMNLPLDPGQIASFFFNEPGATEMKGSWFVFDTYHAHEDWCRWRAPYWHGSPVMDERSHANYHLGFRCCKTLAPR